MPLRFAKIAAPCAASIADRPALRCELGEIGIESVANYRD